VQIPGGDRTLLAKLKLWGALILVLLAVGGGLFGWWALDLHWRPKTITRNQAEIARLLDRAGWVSPGLGGPKLYVVGYRSCEDCVRLRLVEFPKYHKAGVDTRVIMVARRDFNGLSRSTPAERSTVAELWANRSWQLLEAWEMTPPAAWTAPGVKPADDDAGRSAIVEQSRQLVEQLQPMLKQNGIDTDGFRYPTLVWWDKQGRMRACACEKRPSYRFVREELGA
jgi:hypothetical protein